MEVFIGVIVVVGVVAGIVYGVKAYKDAQK